LGTTDGIDPAGAIPGPRRRRGDALVDAIMRAVMQQLETVGYAKLSVEGVAAAAGTGKAALYRRWSGKDDLVAAALRHALPSPAEVPLTGHTRDDLIAVLACMRDSFGLHGSAFQVVKAEAGEALLHNVVQQRVHDPCRDMILVVLGRAADRGEVDPHRVTPLMASVGPAMLIHHTLTRGIDVSDRYLAEIVDDIILPAVRR
jgi:AcrR family transcriptional regulator